MLRERENHHIIDENMYMLDEVSPHIHYHKWDGKLISMLGGLDTQHHG